MRDSMMQVISKLARQDKNVMLLTADLGYSVFEKFEKEFPGQYLNVGVSEQNMTGVAAGLAFEQKKIFTYSIGIFPTLRCLEQIRNDLCYHNLNVNIIGMGGGFSYGALGMTHHATEDIGVIRSLPGIEIIAPCSKNEAQHLISQVVNRPGPSYIRLDKTCVIESGSICFGKINVISQGEDVLFMGIGGVLEECILASNKLSVLGVSSSVLSVHTLKPFDESGFLKECKGKKIIISIEEANKYGGLASAIAETICRHNVSIPFKGVTIDDTYVSTVGDQKYLRQETGLNSENLTNIALNFLNSKGIYEKV
jgi:transketolase